MDGLTQGHGLSHDDAHLFAQARTFRIIHYDGVSASIVLVDLAARAGTILATSHAIFISFRELTLRNSRSPLIRESAIVTFCFRCRRRARSRQSHPAPTMRESRGWTAVYQI